MSDPIKYVSQDNLNQFAQEMNQKQKSFLATKSELSDSVEELEDEISSVRAGIGSPLVSSTVAGMTDTDKVYVYTGSETGYTAGNWYYYNGTAWVSGGIYNAVAIGDNSITDAKLVQTGGVLSEVDYLENELFSNETVLLEQGSIDTVAGWNVVNNARLRTVNYHSLSVKAITFSSSYYCYIYAYKVDGTYVGEYTGSGFTKNWQELLKVYSPIDMASLFGSYDYIYRFVFIKSSGNADKQSLDLHFVLNRFDTNGNEIYTVGSAGDYTSFTDMLVDLENNTNNKIVYVYPGVYDIFDEMGGADYIAGLNITDLNWRDVCHVVPANTTIIGIGDVRLTWNPTDAQIIDNAHAFLFSPLNLSGTCTIKNITILCSNCRYGIHDETSGKDVWDNSIRILENVKVVYSASTYGNKYAYGAGHNKNSKFFYKNCYFESAFGAPYSMHDWSGTQYENSLFNFDNCVLWNSLNNEGGFLRLSSSDAVGRLDQVDINNSVLKGIQFSTEGTSQIKQGYEVKTICCSALTVQFSSYIPEADRIAPMQYLTIS